MRARRRIAIVGIEKTIGTQTVDWSCQRNPVAALKLGLDPSNNWDNVPVHPLKVVVVELHSLIRFRTDKCDGEGTRPEPDG